MHKLGKRGKGRFKAEAKPFALTYLLATMFLLTFMFSLQFYLEGKAPSFNAIIGAEVLTGFASADLSTSGFSTAVVNQTSCGQVNQSITVVQNILSNGTCLTVTK